MAVIGWVGWFPRRAWRWARNLLRRLRPPAPYILFPIEAAPSYLPLPPLPWWRRLVSARGPRSLLEIGWDFERLAADPRVKGVVLSLRPMDLSPAQVEALREMILGLRQSGKGIAAHASSYTTSTYRVAVACERVYLLPGGQVGPLGVAREYRFFADTLARAGVKAQFEKVSPYKSAPETLERSTMSEEARRMANWLADAALSELLQDLGAGRSLEPDQAQGLVDASPLTDLEALQRKAIDGLAAEEDLDRLLGGRVVAYPEAAARVYLPRPRRPGRQVALIRIEGAIVDGRSSRPPLTLPVPVPFLLQERAGDLSVVEAVRRAASRRVGAVVLFVDSPGGSSTASEAITAALSRLAQNKPVVAVMGSTAASGGYYVTTASGTVFAQPGTLTASIGVYSGKIVTSGLLDLLSVGREHVNRGRGVEVASPETLWDEEQRARVKEGVQRVYQIFVERVRGARRGLPENLDEFAGGRVFTGRRALELGLVDRLGGLGAAIEEARRLAGLPADCRVIELHPAGGSTSPTPAGALAYALESVELLNRSVAWLVSELI